jgi:hypothetical protein
MLIILAVPGAHLDWRWAVLIEICLCILITRLVNLGMILYDYSGSFPQNIVTYILYYLVSCSTRF